MQQERRPTGLGYIFSPSAYSNTKRKKVKPEGNGYLCKRPTTIGQKLTNYKDLASNKTRKQTKGGPRPCEHCALCVCCGKNSKSMVTNISQLLTKTKTFKLNQSLTCADFGIYVATCAMCHEQYVGQTSNKFSERWSEALCADTEFLGRWWSMKSLVFPRIVNIYDVILWRHIW